MIYDSDNKSIAFWDRQIHVVFEKPGLYKIHPNNKPAYWVTAGVDPAEGNLEYEIPEISETNKNHVKFIKWKSFGSFVSQYKSFSYNVLWLLLVLFMILEILLWKRT
jgi:hypothetical protein